MGIVDLLAKHCRPSDPDEPALQADEIRILAGHLHDGWEVVEDHHLEKEYDLEDFKNAMQFANQVREIAESEGHHPDLEVGWGKVFVRLRTHELEGLSENDFIVAAKTDEAFHDRINRMKG